MHANWTQKPKVTSELLWHESKKTRRMNEVLTNMATGQDDQSSSILQTAVSTASVSAPTSAVSTECAIQSVPHPQIPTPMAPLCAVDIKRKPYGCQVCEEGLLEL